MRKARNIALAMVNKTIKSDQHLWQRISRGSGALGEAEGKGNEDDWGKRRKLKEGERPWDAA